MRDKLRLIKTILFSSVSVALSYLINFFLTPYITDRLGTEAYGFVSLSRTTVSYASIVTVAFTAFMVRYISLAYHKKNMNEANKYYSSSIASVLFLSFLICIIMFFMVIFLQLIFKIPFNLLKDVKVLFLMVFVGFILETVTVPFSTVFYIKDRLDIYQILKIFSYVFEIIILIISYQFFSSKIWYVGFSLMFAAGWILIGSIISTKKLVPELSFKKKNIQFKKSIDMLQNGIWQSINSLGTTLNSGLDIWITNLLLTPLEMGEISIVKIIVNIFSVLYSTLSQAFQPRMLKAYSTGNINKFLDELYFAMKICGCFSAILLAGFISLGKTYYILWLPNQNYNLLYTLTVISVLSSLTDGIIYPAYYVNTLTTKKKIPCFVTIFTGLLNVFGMFVLLKYTKLGVYSIVITTTVLMLFTNGIFNPIYCAVILKLKWYTLLPLIVKNACVTFLMIFVFNWISNIINVKTWSILILTAIIFCGIGVIIYFICMTSSSEKKNLLIKLRKEKK